MSDSLPRRRSGSRPDHDDAPVLPEITRDESDQGWGEADADERRDRDAWLQRERPPHHEG